MTSLVASKAVPTGTVSRRGLIGTTAAFAAAAFAAPALAQSGAATTEMESDVSSNMRRNISRSRQREC